MAAVRIENARGARKYIFVTNSLRIGLAMIQSTLASKSVGTSSFRKRLSAAARRNDSWLCVGLDPDPSRIPHGVSIESFLEGIVEATGDLVCCFKPQIAFYEALGIPGLVALRRVLEVIPSDIPVLVDAKRSDTPDTMRAYARALFDELGAD